MTLFQLSYALLWLLAAIGTLVSIVLIYLVTNLGEQVTKASNRRMRGDSLIGKSISDLQCEEIVSGRPRALRDVLSERNVVLALSPVCGSCREILDEVLSLSSDEQSGFTLVVLCMGDLRSCRSFTSLRNLSVPMLVYPNARDRSLYILAFPCALIVDAAGMVVDISHPISVRSLLEALSEAAFEPAENSEVARHLRVKSLLHEESEVVSSRRVQNGIYY